jgi:hypothetical protein
MSQPASRNAAAACTASSGVKPPSSQSEQEIRTVTGMESGTAPRTAARTISGKRSRFSRLPPKRSMRRFDSGERKEEAR